MVNILTIGYKVKKEKSNLTDGRVLQIPSKEQRK